MTLPMPEEMTRSDWAIYVRDPSLARVAQIDSYETLQMTPKFNAVGTWKLTIDRRAAGAASLFQPGWGIEVTRDGDRFMAGPLTQPSEKRDDNGGYLATVVGVDDKVWLARRQAHPQPGTTAPPYGSTEHDVRTGVCSTILRQYVDVNLGPSAITPREVAGLSLGVDPVAGTTVTGRARWQVLLDLLAELATSGGGLGFDIVQTGAALSFEVYTPIDRSAEVMFSDGLGTLSSYDYAREAPSVTYTYVGGGGEGTARVIVEREGADAGTWGRIEQFVDRRDTSDVTELTQKADETLTDGAEKVTLGAVPIETPALQFGRDYTLGDRVSLVLDDDGSTAVTELVRQVDVTISPTTQRLTPTIGTPGRLELLRLAGSVRDLSARIRDLERR